ncbi:MAG: hypothetical protein ACK4L7_06190, partial [Flavobacteriales bacterium]
RLAAELAAAERAKQEEEARRKRADEEGIARRYREAIAAADLAFGQDDFNRARDKYTEALGIKPDERYPKDRLAAIESELASREKQRAEAERLEAERRKREEEEAEARRLAEERDRMAREGAKALEERYRASVVAADEALAAKEYRRARGLYAEASDLKPQETYPLAKIDQIDRLLAEMERQRIESEAAARKAAEDAAQQRTKQSTTIDRSNEQQAEEFMRKAREREELEKWERIRKLRDDVLAEESGNASEAAERRAAAVQGKSRIEEQRAGLHQGDETRRELNASELLALKERSALEEARRRQRSEQATTQQYELKLSAQERVIQQEQQRSLQQSRAAETAAGQAERLRAAHASRADASAQRAAAERNLVEQVIEQQAELQRRRAALNEERLRVIEDQKRANAAREAGYVQASEAARARAKEQIDATPKDQPRAFADYNRNKLAQEYPPGVTEESYTEGNKVIIRRIVVVGNRADEYSKVIAKFGVFYFKNGQSITEAIWTRETEG